MFPIFDKLGGIEQAIRLLRPMGPRDTWPSRYTIEDWVFRRKELPPNVRAKLQLICEEHGIRFKASDCVRREVVKQREKEALRRVLDGEI